MQPLCPTSLAAGDERASAPTLVGIFTTAGEAGARVGVHDPDLAIVGQARLALAMMAT